MHVFEEGYLRPYWVTYPAQVTLAEAQTVYLDLDAEDGYRPRAERLDAALTDATRLARKRCSAIRRRCGAWWRPTGAATTTSCRR